MKQSLLKWFVTGCCGILAACAIITVNVYFPEKDVKQAYKSLDDMLLHQGDAKIPGRPGTARAKERGEAPVKPLASAAFLSCRKPLPRKAPLPMTWRWKWP